jgi:hypothetical protein
MKREISCKHILNQPERLFEDWNAEQLHLLSLSFPISLSDQEIKDLLSYKLMRTLFSSLMYCTMLVLDFFFAWSDCSRKMISQRHFSTQNAINGQKNGKKGKGKSLQSVQVQSAGVNVVNSHCAATMF